MLTLSYLTEHVQSVVCVRQCQLPVVEEMLSHWWGVWSVARAESRAREMEEQSLYKYRSKTHVIQESEEEVSESQLREMFPVYEEWTEEEEMDVEEDGGGREEEGEAEGSPEATHGGCEMFTSEEWQFVVDLHLKLHNGDAAQLQLKNFRDIAYEIGSSLTRLLERIPGKGGNTQIMCYRLLVL